MKYWETPQFKKLQNEWTEKLEQAGFVDAEIQCGDERHLRQNASNVYRQADQLTRESKQRYFEIIGQKVQAWRGGNPLTKSILRMHAEGMLPNEIRAKLALGGVRIQGHTITYTIRRMLKRWKLPTP